MRHTQKTHKHKYTHTYITHAHTHTDAHTHTAGWETKSSVNTIILCWTCLLTTAVPQGVAYSKFVKKNV